MQPHSSPRFSPLLHHLLVFTLPALAMAGPVFPPPESTVFVQTNGRATASLGRGDWYSSESNGTLEAGEFGSHYVRLFVPSGWPAGTPIHLDILSPEYNATNPTPPTPRDEDGGGAPPATDPGSTAVTRFELFPGTTTIQPTDPGAIQPGDGIAGSLGSFPWSASAPDWVRWYTITSPAPGTSYIVRIDSNDYNGDNSYRLRAGFDDDSNPTNTPPVNADNPDGIEGSDDELEWAPLLTTYQHNDGSAGAAFSDGSNACHTYFTFIPEGTPSLVYHNFDMDGAGRIRYYAPSDTAFDERANSGGIAGTISGQAVWNNGGTDTTRVGDTITNPEFGYWRVVACIPSNNQYTFESPAALNTFFTPPRRPDLDVTVVPNVANPPLINQNDLLNNEFSYTVTFANNADAFPADERGAAKAITIVTTLDPRTELVGAQISPGFTGSTSYNAATRELTININQVVVAGEVGTAEFTVRLTELLTGPDSLTISTSVSHVDSFDQVWPTVTEDFTLTNDAPLLVKLESFEAEHGGPGTPVFVRWVTSAEVDSVGFDVYRVRTGPGGEPVSEKVNGEMIWARGSEFEGAAYQLLDPVVMEADEVREYLLVETELYGTENTYGPVVVRAGKQPTGVPDWLEMR